MTFEEVRAKLRRRLKSCDECGFAYDMVFGCERADTLFSPHVLVRVELRATDENLELAYEVFVDFHLPLGVDLESAEYFKKVTGAAVRKARWAHSVTDGLSWHRSELKGGL